MKTTIAVLFLSLAACHSSKDSGAPPDTDTDVVDTDDTVDTDTDETGDPDTDETDTDTGDPDTDETDTDTDSGETDLPDTGPTDADSDGIPLWEDCDDDNPAVGAPAPWYPDADADGHGDETGAKLSCEPNPGFIATGGDCNDADAAFHPGAPDPCDDFIDQDCDGRAGECGLQGQVPLTDADAVLVGVGGSAGNYAYGAGDVDADGFPNIVVSAPYAAGGLGVVYLLDTPVSGEYQLSGADAVVEGEDASAYMYGAPAGDVNGDGLDDLVFGAGNECGNSRTGEAYLIYSPVPAIGNVVNADGRFMGEINADGVGKAATGAGDTDGDGLDDILIGGTQGPDGQGVVYLVPGPALGNMNLVDVDTRISGIGGISGMMALPPVRQDIDGDGYADVVVGGADIGTGYSGAFVFHGPIVGPLDVVEADFSVTGGDGAGGSVDVGDFDADGVFDMVVGISGMSAISFQGGAACTYLGPLEGALATDSWDARVSGASFQEWLGASVAAGDTNGDGAADLFAGSAMYGGGSGLGMIFTWPFSGDLLQADATAELQGSGSESAAYSADLPGDLNSDGIGDIIVGAPNHRDGGVTTGAVYVIHTGD